MTTDKDSIFFNNYTRQLDLVKIKVLDLTVELAKWEYPHVTDRTQLSNLALSSYTIDEVWSCWDLNYLQNRAEQLERNINDYTMNKMTQNL